MYEAFYGFRERPFNLTPDPKYLYLSEKHKEAFAHLLYGIKNRSGFVMISGEIGTGKTTLCRNLLNQLDANTEVAFIFNPFLNPIELMKKINQEFGITSKADTILGLTEELNVHLLHSAAHGKNCVLVIDEAQNLAPQVLEQIRLLSNLETDSEKLLQIILIGQPELAEKLALRELRQLNQRITARYHLKALNSAETLQYIAYRLHIAGGRKRLNFTKGAIKLVYRHSGGVPRMINAITDRALLIGYTKEQHVINAPIVRRAAREIRGEKIASNKTKRIQWRSWLPSPSVAALVVLALVLTHYLVDPLDRFVRELNTLNRIFSGDIPIGSETDSSQYGAATADIHETGNVPDDRAAPATDNLSALRLVMERLNSAGQSSRPSQALAPILTELDAEDTLRAGLDTLVSLWNRNLVENGHPADANAESLRAFFADQGLACEHLRPTVEQLLNINLPGLVRLSAGEREVWMGALRADDETITLQAGPNRRVTVPLAEFSTYYGRELLAVWKDPAPNAPVLLPGHRGPQVQALKAQLRELGRIAPSNMSDIYDSETEAAVLALQEERGLTIDGKAGPQVRLALVQWSDDVPLLRRGVNRTAMTTNKTSWQFHEDPPAAAATARRQLTENLNGPEDTPPAGNAIHPARPSPDDAIALDAAVVESAPLQHPPIDLPVLTTPAAPMREPASPVQERELLRLLRANTINPPETEHDEAGALTEVRVLEDPFTHEGAPVREMQRQPDITEPVHGSTPLIPREEPRP